MERVRIKKAFTLVELMIVVSILGILGAIVLPAFGDHIQKAKEAAAKDTLRLIRTSIQRYAADHNDVPPGYVDGALGPNGSLISQMIRCSDINGNIIDSVVPTGNYIYGPYISDIPANPFNDKITIVAISDGGSFPAEATGNSGWIYKAATKDVRIDYPGTDSQGDTYYEY